MRRPTAQLPRSSRSVPAKPRHDNKRDRRGSRSALVDVDQLEKLLIAAARGRRSLTYAEVLAHFGMRITPRRVYALCRDLGAVCERNRARGEPELAVLVVRKSDRLPGEGFFHSFWRDGTYDGPATGPVAMAFIRRETAAVFAYWRGDPPASAGPRS
jgi:hypothetical protein